MGRNPKDDKPGTANTTSNPAPQTAAPYASSPSYSTESQYRPSLETSTPARAVTESESLARDIKDGTLSGFVGSSSAITGEANFKAMLRIDGHFSGRITSEGGTLIVSAGGQVDANIEVAVAIINGSVNGDIIATKRIELGRVAKVVGNIQTPSLGIEQGAIFEGSCRMIQARTAMEKQSPATAYVPSVPVVEPVEPAVSEVDKEEDEESETLREVAS
jgi:cytoskeletal protein CcmA (bactofilin family)